MDFTQDQKSSIQVSIAGQRCSSYRQLPIDEDRLPGVRTHRNWCLCTSRGSTQCLLQGSLMDRRLGIATAILPNKKKKEYMCGAVTLLTDKHQLVELRGSRSKCNIDLGTRCVCVCTQLMAKYQLPPPTTSSCNEMGGLSGNKNRLFCLICVALRGGKNQEQAQKQLPLNFCKNVAAPLLSNTHPTAFASREQTW